jgi:hypothetical protein
MLSRSQVTEGFVMLYREDGHHSKILGVEDKISCHRVTKGILIFT